MYGSVQEENRMNASPGKVVAVILGLPVLMYYRGFVSFSALPSTHARLC
jgi:hypothetical protein